MEPIQIEDVKRLAVQPGDTIVLTVSRLLSDRQRAVIHTEIMDAFGPGVRTLVLDGEATLSVVGGGVAE